METLDIFSAGAAQAVVARLVQRFQLNGGGAINSSYGAVHSLKSRVLAGEPVDVIVLTDGLIDELIHKNRVVAGSRVDLGTVGTGIAVRAGMPPPPVGSPQALRATLLACEKIFCPDPAAATAGKALLNVLEQLGIGAQLQPRLMYCASGYEAMDRLAQGSGQGELGVMQMTEIIASRRITLAGPFPAELQMTALYSAGLTVQSKCPERAAEFIQTLAQDRHALKLAGFGDCPVREPVSAAHAGLAG
ncbi:MAG: molybdate transporter substrate-binding protein [Polaromonas sp.]|nr:molybdate transporter substrate-binding protein [Polaromonas sp.]